jgi:hypothetical protein
LVVSNEQQLSGSTQCLFSKQVIFLSFLFDFMKAVFFGEQLKVNKETLKSIVKSKISHLFLFCTLTLRSRNKQTWYEHHHIAHFFRIHPAL